MQFATLFFCLLSLSAQVEASEKIAQDLIRTYWQNLASKNYFKVAQTLNNEELKTFKETFVPLYEIEFKEGKNDLLKATFGPDISHEVVRTVTAEELFSKVIEFTMKTGGMVSDIKILEPEVIGAVKEGENVIHVVYRYHFKYGEKRSSDLQVMSVSKTEGIWKVLMPETFKLISQKFKQAIVSKIANKPIKPD